MPHFLKSMVPALCAVIVSASSAPIASGKLVLNDKNDRTIYMMAHRGNTSDRTIQDNSITGLNAAIEAGADIIEVDVWRTNDGVLVCWHDWYIYNEEANKIYEHTYEECVRMANGKPIPTLEEYLTAGKGRVGYNIDKIERNLQLIEEGKVPSSFTAELVGLVQKLEMVDDVIFYTGNPTRARQILAIEPTALIGVYGEWDESVSAQYPQCQYYVQTDYAADHPEWMGSFDPKYALCVNLLCDFWETSSVKRDELNLDYVDDILRRWPSTKIIQSDVSDLLINDLKMRWRYATGYGDNIFVTPEGRGDRRGGDWENAMDASTFRELLWFRGEDHYHYSNAQALRGKTIRLAEGEYCMTSYEWGVKMKFNPDEAAVSFSIDGGYDPALTGRDLSRKTGKSTLTIHRDPTATQNAMIWMAGKSYVSFTDCDFDGGYQLDINDIAHGQAHALVCGDPDSPSIDSDVFLVINNSSIHNFNTVGLDTEGGAILMRSGAMRLRDCKLYHNIADNRGAVLQIINNTPYPVSCMMDRCSITRNYTNGWWGLVAHLRGGSLLMNNTSIIDNHNLDQTATYALINGSNGGHTNSAYLIVNSTLHQTSPQGSGTIRFDSDVNHATIINSVITNDNPNSPSVHITSAEKGIYASSAGFNVMGDNVNLQRHDKDSHDTYLNNNGYISDDDYIFDARGLPHLASLEQIETTVRGFKPSAAPWYGDEFWSWVNEDKGFGVDRRGEPRNPGAAQPGAYDAGPSILTGTTLPQADQSQTTSETARFDMYGRLLTVPSKGVNIVVMNDGTTRKEIVR